MSCLDRFIMFTKYFCKKRCWNKLIGQDSLISLLLISYFVLDFVLCVSIGSNFHVLASFFLYKLIFLANFPFYLFQICISAYEISIIIFFLDLVLMLGWSFSKQECVSMFSFSWLSLLDWCYCILKPNVCRRYPPISLELLN